MFTYYVITDTNTNEGSGPLGIISILLSVITKLTQDTKISNQRKQLNSDIISTSDLPTTPLPLSTTTLPPSTSDAAAVHFSSFFSSYGSDYFFEFVHKIFLSIQTYSAIIQNKQLELHAVKCLISFHNFYINNENDNINSNKEENANHDEYHKVRARRISSVNDSFGIYIQEFKKSIFDINSNQKKLCQVIKTRDSIGNLYVHGGARNSQMTTDETFAAYFSKAKIDNKTTFETKGLWKMNNDFMSGPFINYNIFDPKRSRILVVEGFCYAPSKEKRDLMFELEAIIKSIKLK